MHAVIFLGLAFLGLSSFANSDVRMISVSGQCLRKVSPDRGTVTVVPQFTEKTAAIASRKAMDSYEKLRKSIQKMNLKDLEMQTSEYSVQEVFDYQNGKRISRGLQASLGLQVSTSEISRLGDIVALASDLDVQRVESLSTYLSPERSKTSREACLVEAIKNAKDKAEKMAESARAKVGEVQLIDENLVREISTPEPRLGLAKMEAASADASISPTIESKPEVISVNVLVKFALK